MEVQKPKVSANGSFEVLFFAIFIDLLGFGIIIPIIPFLVKEIDPSREGILLAYLLASYSLAQFVFAPLWGRLSDRVGRRPIILIGLFGSSIGFALFGIVETYSMYLLSRIIAGIFTGASLPTARAYVADITPPEERARRFGLLGAAFGIGFTFGPAIGSLLSLNIFRLPGLPSQATASLFAALLALINFVLATRNLPESLDIDKVKDIETIENGVSKFLHFFSYKGIPILLLIFGITIMIFSGFESMFALFANFVDARITEDNIGYFFGLIGILVAVFQSSLVGPTVDRFGEEFTIVIGLSFQIVGYLLLSLSWSFLSLLVFVIPLGLGQALVTPTINSAISNRIPNDQQGGGLGITSSIGSLGRIVGPLYGGILYDAFMPSMPFLVGAGVLVFVVFIAANFLEPIVELQYQSDEVVIN